jgi:hypothetical protein
LDRKDVKKMSLPTKIKHYLEQKEPLFARVTPTSENLIAWISVFPYMGLSLDYFDPDSKFVLRWAEVPRQVFESHQLTKEGLDYTDAINFMRRLVKDEAELEILLSAWVSDFETLVPSWRSDYPFYG